MTRRALFALVAATVVPPKTPPGVRFHREAFTLVSQPVALDKWSEVEFEWKFDEFVKVVELA
jgi:hypothetical protein